MLENLLQFKEQLEVIAPLTSIQIADYEDYEINVQEEIVKRYQKCIEELQKEDIVKAAGTFENRFYELNGNEEDVIRGMVIPGSILSVTKFKLIEGSVEEFLVYDGRTDEIPVLVTDEMAGFYPYGSVFLAKEENVQKEQAAVTCRVTGVISSDMKYWNGDMIPIAESVKACSGTCFIMPTVETGSDLASYQYNTIVIPSKRAESEHIKNMICDLFEKNGLFIDAFSLEDQIQEFYMAQKPIIVLVGGFAVILLLLSVLGCVGTLLASILQRKEEFGIYITLGFTKRQLLQMVFSEILILFISAFILAVLGCTFLLRTIQTVTNVGMDFRILAMGCGIMIVCVICSAILPLWKVNSLQPIELIEGRE